MEQGEKGVAPHHARAGMAHDRPHLGAFGGAVAMDGAFGAGWFGLAEDASVEADLCVIEQGLALGAESLLFAVVIFAEQLDHGGNGLPTPSFS